MYTDTINKCAANAARIVKLAKESPLGFWIGSAMAGAYVGLGIILIFTLGNLIDPAYRPLVMGATFGLALTLVIIAGSELFTGHTMFLTFGVKAGTIKSSQMWPFCHKPGWEICWVLFLSPCSITTPVAVYCRLTPVWSIAPRWQKPRRLL